MYGDAHYIVYDKKQPQNKKNENIHQQDIDIYHNIQGMNKYSKTWLSGPDIRVQKMVSESWRVGTEYWRFVTTVQC